VYWYKCVKTVAGDPRSVTVFTVVVTGFRRSFDSVDLVQVGSRVGPAEAGHGTFIMVSRHHVARHHLHHGFGRRGDV
jgi:hypothetical protein